MTVEWSDVSTFDGHETTVDTELALDIVVEADG
jgi:hypothetical protein